MFYHEVVDGVYAKAKITNGSNVGLFLGSNVMVEYTVEEARQLLTKNIGQVMKQITDCERNMEFIKEQMTIVEVGVSRVFNHDVQQRKKAAGM